MKAVIFDLGRVLVQWDPAPVLAGLREVSQAGDADLQALWYDVLVPFETGQLDASGIHRYLIDHIGTTADWQRFYPAFCRGLARNEEGLAYARELIGRPDVKVGVISDTNAIHAVWLREHLPELAAMDAVLLSPEVGMVKPDPAIFRLALERLAVRPGQALFVDDLPANVAAAQAVGMAGLLHRDWNTSRNAIEKWLTEAV